MASETQRKYKDIRKEYESVWLKKRYKGVAIYSADYIFVKLAEKYYLSPKTVENIVCHIRPLIAAS